jgi:uncharacterized protein (DUF488 family)
MADRGGGSCGNDQDDDWSIGSQFLPIENLCSILFEQDISMYYRRIFLLALIDAFGGSLSDTDCNKLVFLFGQTTGRSYYDFFPYKFGAFSHILFQDKLNLTRGGYLEDSEQFQIKQETKHIAQLRAEDSVALDDLVSMIGKTRGTKLLKKVYQEYPYFASRSTVAPDILDEKDLHMVSLSTPKQRKSCLFTIGYEGLSIDSYLNRLLLSNVRALVDVRKNPISMKFGFSKNQLKRYVENLNIAYYHLPGLGIDSNLRQGLKSYESYQALFAFYQSKVLPTRKSDLNAICEILNQKKRVALTCFESAHTSCHRHKISEHFEHDPHFIIPVVHL